MCIRERYINGLWNSVDEDHGLLPRIVDLSQAITAIDIQLGTLRYHNGHPETTPTDIKECLHNVIVTALRVAEDLRLTV